MRNQFNDDRTVLHIEAPKAELRIFRLYNIEPRYRVEIKAPEGEWGRMEFEEGQDKTRSLPKATSWILQMDKVLRESDLTLKKIV